MNKNLDNKQKEYIKKFLIERLDNIEQALEDNLIFYKDELDCASSELDMINSILERDKH